jgi:hypothetical protein
MQAFNTTIAQGLQGRITSVALKTYEMEQLRVAAGAQVLRPTGFCVHATEALSDDCFQFACVLTLKADPGSGERPAASYEVSIAGDIVFDSPAWDLGQFHHVAAPFQPSLW